ncbi:MAG: Gfo/Idh/MocA family protein [Planctomycetota bacterium]
MNNKFSAIGCGKRSKALLEHLYSFDPGVTLKGAFDPNEENARDILATGKSPDGVIYKSFEEAVNDPDISWVMIGSPNYLHCEHVTAAFAAGKHVFAEKPLATEIADCQKMVDAHEKSDLLFATGFVLRYAEIYRKMKSLLDAGTIGKIVSIDANENITPGHGGHIMINWRRDASLSGGHIVEKCCHDIDLLNWFVNSLPVKVCAFAGQNMYTPENKELFNLQKDGKSAYQPWYADGNPFISDNTVEDNLVSILEYQSGVRVQFQATVANAIPERRISIQGTEGNIISELYSSTLNWKRVDESEKHQLTFTGSNLHGGGDTHIMKAFADSMLTGKEPECSGREGMLSTVTAIAIRDSFKEEKIIKLVPVWENLGVL